MSYDLIGLETLVDQEHGEPSTGWTAPTVIWERMKQIDLSADSLNGAMLANAKSPLLLDAWKAWYARWKRLVDRYDSWTAKLGAATYSDDLAAEIEVERQTLVRFEANYRDEAKQTGQPMPPVPGGMPSSPIPPPPPKENRKLEIPWWVWILGGTAIVGGVYLIRKRYIATKADPRFQEMTNRYGLPSTSQIDNARREVTQASHRYLNAGRDPSRDHEDPRYDRGTVMGGVQMCPCPNQGLHEMATFDPES